MAAFPNAIFFVKSYKASPTGFASPDVVDLAWTKNPLKSEAALEESLELRVIMYETELVTLSLHGKKLFLPKLVGR